MFCHQYPTRACVAGNGGVRSLWDNVTSSTRTATEFVRIGCDCQHQGGRELRSNGMVNVSESLLIVVSTSKPKVLIGLSQNGKWSSVEAAESSTADVAPPAKRRDLPHSLLLIRNVVSPYSSHSSSHGKVSRKANR